MESPAKGDSRQGLKGTQKHLEFQLQREKAYTRELEEKVKLQQAQIATLEQDKAELRREKLMHTDDDKKRGKLEERCHTLQKDLSEKQSALVAEQKRAARAECEKEQIRRDAHASIAKWCDAEKQWITENETIQRQLEESRTAYSKLADEFKELNVTLKEVQKQLQREKDHTTKLESLSHEGEKKITLLHSRIEALQNDVHTRDETVFKLEEAKSKWEEVCHVKDNEIKSLEVQLGMQKSTIEKLQNTVSTLNQQIEAAKLINIEEKGRVEKANCDLRESEKGNKLLMMELETMRRDFEHASENSSKHQEVIVELRSKISALNDQVIEKCAESRKYELSVSQLKADVNRLEQERTDSSRRAAILESNLQELRSALERTRMDLESVISAKSFLETEFQRVKSMQDTKDENLVLMRVDYEEKIDSLRREAKDLTSEIDARRGVIDKLTGQLGEANARNEDLYRKVMQSSEFSTQLRSATEEMQLNNFMLQVKVLELEEQAARWSLSKESADENLDIHGILVVNIDTAVTHFYEETNLLKKKVEELTHQKDTEILRLSEARLRLEAERSTLIRGKEELVEELRTKEAEILDLQEGARRDKEQLFLLGKEIERENINNEDRTANQKVLSDKLIETENLLREATLYSEDRMRLSQWMANWLEHFSRFFVDIVDQYSALTVEKTLAVAEEYRVLYTNKNDELLRRLSHLEKVRRNAEDMCSHLELKLREIESRVEGSEKLLVEQREGLTRKINVAENEKEKAEKNSENLMEKISDLSRQHAADIQKKDDQVRELSRLLDTEKRNVDELEQRTQKLRSKLDYEISRKGEYKKALEAVKAKREETECFRAKEKDWAMKAIHRANEEVNYWIKSFEQLKGMLEDMSRKSGAQITAVDKAKIQQMEVALCRVSVREPNLISNLCDEGNCGAKRQRSN
ncbi:uncharacterized protein TEOVI_000207500 [Trypanosoma equiperdum]|uniref:Uncharacterized protein n=1 Tax=Trypanosoma equiperdum TaxID=5694 RepID=A0A1G4IDP7_TRYEQ|nr:hypothetical protein, conserved [Trypanosoma equiperdum]